MGLDISLDSRSGHEADEAYDKAWEEWWEEWHEKPDGPEKTAAHDAIPPSSGGENPPSERYPDHLFNRRYLRSSYNGGGFNRAVPDMVGEDHGLYWIFQPVIGDDGEPYSTELTISHVQLLEDVKKRALQVAREIKDADPLRTMTADAFLGPAEHMWHGLPTEEQVLAWYRDEQARHLAQAAKLKEEGKEDHLGDGSYMTAKGLVLGFEEGFEVLAATLGANPLSAFSAMMPANTIGANLGAMPVVVLVYRLSDEAKESYVQSAEIVAEFCDEAIGLIHADGSCFMHWSG